jgi:hypothetical protein
MVGGVVDAVFEQTLRLLIDGAQAQTDHPRAS